MITALMLVAGCATLPSSQHAVNAEMSWAKRQQQLTTISHWQTQGAIALISPQQQISGNFTWQQINSTDYQLTVAGPLRLGQVVLTGNAAHVTLTTGNKIYRANSPEQLMQSVLGWQLPLKPLFYWAKGLPAPNQKPIIKYDQYHHIKTLQQFGWTVDYLRYTSVNGVDVPSFIKLHYKQLQVKLVFSRWQL